MGGKSGWNVAALVLTAYRDTDTMKVDGDNQFTQTGRTQWAENTAAMQWKIVRKQN